MDSVTQVALGASVGELVLGRRIGNRALLLGAVVGSLPDLDVLISFGGAVEDFTYHRSFSHSLIILTLAAPLIAIFLHWAGSRWWPDNGVSLRRWWLMTWLALITHPMLDSFTVYGTQLFWPLSDYPVSGSSMFIIDPLYTLILVAGIVFAWRRTPKSHVLNTVGLCLSSLYLLWSVTAKLHAHSYARDSLAAQSISYDRLLSTPMPFTTLGWRFVIMNKQGYSTGYYSLLDSPGRLLQLSHFSSDTNLLTNIADHWPVRRLQEFTHGFYRVRQVLDEVQITDLRMGIEGAYVFNFTVAEKNGLAIQPVISRRADTSRDLSAMGKVLRRVVDEDVVIP